MNILYLPILLYAHHYTPLQALPFTNNNRNLIKSFKKMLLLKNYNYIVDIYFFLFCGYYVYSFNKTVYDKKPFNNIEVLNENKLIHTFVYYKYFQTPKKLKAF